MGRNISSASDLLFDELRHMQATSQTSLKERVRDYFQRCLEAQKLAYDLPQDAAYDPEHQIEGLRRALQPN
jgi:hypothetical protein